MKPYLSIVLTGRNDDYGGDFNSRLSRSLRWLTHHIESSQLPAELVLVNYNPINNKPSLKETIEWDQNRQYLQYRIITIPAEIHQTLINPQIRKTVPLFEFPAKNAGIRRARGEYILSTNADIVFAPEILQFIGKQQLAPNFFYRTDRCDFLQVDEGLEIIENKEAYINQIQQNTFLVSLKGNKYEMQVKNGKFFKQLMSLRFRNRVKLAEDLLLARYPKFFRLFTKRYINFDNAEFRYHCNNCGDFMLMQSDKWHQLHSYPENTYISTHTDALFTIMAATLGLKEKVLRWPIYHQHHQRRYTWNAIENQQDEVMTKVYRYFEDEAQKMLKNKQPTIYNDKNWGLAQYTFHEELL